MQSSASIEVAAVTFDVTHTTRYEYSESVSVSHHIARLRPRELARQRCSQHELHIDPPPASLTTSEDYFGNTMTVFVMGGAHTSLTVRATSRVSISASEVPAA